MLTTTDYMLLLIDAMLWIAIGWRGVRSRAVGELWWSCVCLAVIITLKIGVIADPFNLATGGVYLGVLITNVAAVIAAHLTVQWQVLVRHGTRRPWRITRFVALAAITTFLVTTWFTAPVYDVSPESEWIPTAVLGDAVMAVHWLIFHAYILGFVVIFIRSAWQDTLDLPAGSVRTSLYLLIAGAALLLANAGIGVGAQIFVLTGTPYPPALMFATNMLLVAFFAMFLLAVSIPMAGRGRRRRETEQIDESVASLWTWIHSTGPGDATSGPHGIVRTAPGDLLDQIVEIRDRMWLLQQYVAPAELAAATREARRSGLLFGTAARAFVTAACLEIAARAVDHGAPTVDPPPANLSRLGGGRTQRQEAQWLAAVSRALTARFVPSTSG